MATIKAGTYRFNDELSAPLASIRGEIPFVSQWSVPQEYLDALVQEGVDISGIDNPITIKGDIIDVGLGSDGYFDMTYNITETNSFVLIEDEQMLFPELGERFLYVKYSNGTRYWSYGFHIITIVEDTEVSAEFYEWFAENAAEQKYLSGLWLSHPEVSAIPYEIIPWNFDMGEEEALYSKYGIEIEPMLVEGEYWAYGFTPVLTRCRFDADGTLLGSEIGGIGKFKNVGEEDYYYAMTVTYAPDYDTAHIIPGNYNALSVDWVKSNFTELKALSGTWWIDTDSPAIPYEVIPYHSGREEEEALYNNYGVDIEPIYYPPNNNTIYGGTPLLTMAYVGEDGEILGYFKRIINKVKEEGEDFYRYKSYTNIDSDYNKITVIPGYYNAMIVDWFYQFATNVRFARLYPSEVAYSSGGKCFKKLAKDEPTEETL